MLLNALFLVIISLSMFQAQVTSSEQIIVQVKYSRQPISRTEGQSLALRCTAVYEEQQCGNISVVWCLSPQKFSFPLNSPQRLTDPDRYLIQVSETKVDNGFRHRETIVTFKRLAVEDTSLYQCHAECQRTGAKAMGHLINITVTGQKEKTSDIIQEDSNEGQVTHNPSVRCSADAFLLSLSTFLILWS